MRFQPKSTASFCLLSAPKETSERLGIQSLKNLTYRQMALNTANIVLSKIYLGEGEEWQERVELEGVSILWGGDL